MSGQDKRQCSETFGVTGRAIGKVYSGLSNTVAITAFQPGNCKLYPNRAIPDGKRPELPNMTASKRDIPAIATATAKVMFLLSDNKLDCATFIASALILIA
jgi:hypothetical protein